MPQEFSFDVVSKIDLQTADDAVNAGAKEISTRFDFKGSVSGMSLDKKEGQITLTSDDEGKLKSVVDILQSRWARRGLPLKGFEAGKIEPAEGGTVRQKYKILQGIAQDKAKQIVAAIKETKMKVTPSIQGEQVRVASKSKDELQAAMTLLKTKDFGVALQFANFR
jgi:uncharacterized protein YajQ (UPF0234 family)